MMYLLFYIDETCEEQTRVDDDYYNRDMSYSPALAQLFYLKPRSHVCVHKSNCKSLREKLSKKLQTGGPVIFGTPVNVLQQKTQ